MGRRCIIKGCQSGRNPDRKQRKQLGIRQVSIFQVPKCQDLRKKWSKALVTKLQLGNYVCEYHFNDLDIKRQDETILPDGTIVAIPLHHHLVHRNAIPSLRPVKCENTEIDETNARIRIQENLPAIELNAHSTARDTRTRSPSVQLGRFEELLDDTDTEDDSDNNKIQENCPRSQNTESLERIVPEPDEFNIDHLTQCLEITPLPKGWAWVTDMNTVTLVRLDFRTCKTILHIKTHAPDGGQMLELHETIKNMLDLLAIIRAINEKKLCVGTSIEQESRARQCIVSLSPEEYAHNVRESRCTHCRQLRRQLQNRTNRPKVDYAAKYAQVRHELDCERRKHKRSQKQAAELKTDIRHAKQKCAAAAESAIDAEIQSLPEIQQTAVKSCFNAAKVVNTKRRRYTLEWVYECILMRIKNSNLYEYLRTRNILPLPCKDTINRYIQRMDTAYGFQTAVFDCLKLKASRMEVVNKRGALLIDEMALSEAISLDTKTMMFKGFVDLGNFTPKKQQNDRADHALVFMFQPFRGGWVQVLGSFLSKNSVTSQILHKFILECLLLLGESSFHVDVVTMDGAQWNRGVWSLFGISDGHFSCEHPCNPAQRLWMISDFPHLIKCLRNGLMKTDSFWTPDGFVMKNHWQALLDREGYMKSNLRIAYKLTPIHINPTGYQTMNVPLAFQLFSDRVRIAMEIFKDDPKCPQLRTAGPTIKLCEIVDNLITAMMSRTPAAALRPNDECVQKKAIQNFDRYLRDWERAAKKQNRVFPISSSTVSGLKVTLGSTLELIQFLHNEYNYDYLMTARLNQDALERFFGMMRNACGSNDHPDPTLFAQVFRLLASYSLVKPPKGGNVCGVELLQTLMQTRESITTAGYSKEQWLKKIDKIIETGSPDNEPEDNCTSNIFASEHDYDSTHENHHDHMTPHDYDVVTTSDEVQTFIAGYVARQIKRFTNCELCIESVETDERTDRHRLIDLMDRYGGLLYPSDQLFELAKKLEAAVLDVVGKFTVKINTLHQILD